MVLMLDRKGIAVSIAMGLITLVSGGGAYLLLFLVFLALSVAVTRYGEEEKKGMGIYEYERSWENVLSNGIVPTCFAILHPFLGPLPFIASVAAISSDKFASELGVLQKKKPIYLFNLKEVRPGTSGAISTLGTIMSVAGAAAIAAAAVFLLGIAPSTALLVMFGGFGGNLVDTIAGIAEEKGIGNKFTSNMLGSLAGGIFGMVIRQNI